jgi:uncharacterized protein YjiS (DUF1127 family)
MHTLHTLRLPAPPAAGPFARLIAECADAWRGRRLRRATAATLHSLDDRTLGDLGLHRSEIGGIAAEIGHRAETTYVRAQLAHYLRA